MNARSRIRGHNASCECSPEVALKIQFLRLVHSFCDHSDYKHLLPSVPELEELEAINSKAGILAVRNVPDVDITWMCRGEKVCACILYVARCVALMAESY